MIYIKSEKIIGLYEYLSEYFPNLTFEILNLDFQERRVSSIEDLEQLNRPSISTMKRIRIEYNSRIKEKQVFRYEFFIHYFIVKKPETDNQEFMDFEFIKSVFVKAELEEYSKIYQLINHN